MSEKTSKGGLEAPLNSLKRSEPIAIPEEVVMSKSMRLEAKK